jgi:acetate kinase
MRILALNCGSSSLKFQVVEVERGRDGILSENCRAKGRVKLGADGRIELQPADGQKMEHTAPMFTHADGVRRLLQWPDGQSALRMDALQAVGHRVVHGGDEFKKPTLINERVLQSLDEIGRLAPLHNRAALEVIRETHALLGGSTPMVATFDTTFHRTLPAHARRYAIPLELTTKHRLWRYGFHGLAHRRMMERYAVLAGRPAESARLITLQLGSGCSITAIRNGQSVETSMGLTPLEGLMMATRSGDVDPALAGFLARQEGWSVDRVEECLNTRSGLLGVHGESGDVRVLLDAERIGNDRAALALEMFCHRIRKYLGAYLAVLGGADAILFGGGIGENRSVIRARIAAGMSWCGLQLDEKRNEAAIGKELRISADNSPISAYVVPVNEEALIARDTFQCLRPSHAESEGESDLRARKPRPSARKAGRRTAQGSAGKSRKERE